MQTWKTPDGTCSRRCTARRGWLSWPRVHVSTRCTLLPAAASDAMPSYHCLPSPSLAPCAFRPFNLVARESAALAIAMAPPRYAPTNLAHRQLNVCWLTHRGSVFRNQFVRPPCCCPPRSPVLISSAPVFGSRQRNHDSNHPRRVRWLHRGGAQVRCVLSTRPIPKAYQRCLLTEPANLCQNLTSGGVGEETIQVSIIHHPPLSAR